MPFNRLRSILGIDDTSPKGMGDVKMADSAPIEPLTGYGSPEQDKQANKMAADTRRSVYRGGDPGLETGFWGGIKPTQEDVDRNQWAESVGSGTAGMMKNVSVPSAVTKTYQILSKPEAIQQYMNTLPKIPENMAKLRALAQLAYGKVIKLP